MTEDEHQMRDRLAIAYAAAMKASHGGNRVEIKVGAKVKAYLESKCVKPTSEAWIPSGNRLWGFPVIIAEPPALADLIEVHTVERIF